MSQDLVDSTIRPFSLADYRELVIAVGGHANARRIISGECSVELKLIHSSISGISPKILDGLLQQASERIYFPEISTFSVRENFQEKLDNDLPISVITYGFHDYCDDIIEMNVPATWVMQWRVIGKISCDSGILSLFKSNPEKLVKDKQTIAFARIKHFLKTADPAEHFVFYVKDNNRKIWAITAHMFRRGWSIGVRPYGYPQEIPKRTLIIFPSDDS
jgi:hypothetical protein